MKCENCGQEHDSKYGSGRFCSQECARGFSTKKKRKEINQKVSNKLKSMYQSGELVQAFSGKTQEEFPVLKKIANDNKTRSINRIMSSNFSQLSKWEKKKRVLYEQSHKCNKCGIDEWNGNPITLELDHKDGNNRNDDRNNLEALCPNCHSQTDTWKGKHKNNHGKQKVTNLNLARELSKNDFQIRKTLRQLGLAESSANIQRCHRIIDFYTSSRIPST